MLDTTVRISLGYLIKYIPGNCIEFSVIINNNNKKKKDTENLQNIKHFSLKENEPTYSLLLLIIIFPHQFLMATCHWQYLA